MSKTFCAMFKVFGERTYEIKATTEDTLMDALKRLELLPDEYIITTGGIPVPCDSNIEKKDYVLYKVPSGG